jgi:hypothetical protein
VIEALASGGLVVGTEVGDVARLVRMPSAGYFVRAADSKALSDAIAKRCGIQMSYPDPSVN